VDRKARAGEGSVAPRLGHEHIVANVTVSARAEAVNPSKEDIELGVHELGERSARAHTHTHIERERERERERES
jgi:hypothetical protein